MSGISTHVLDTARGRPAAGVPVVLSASADGDAWTVVGRGTTDEDGRVRDLLVDLEQSGPGTYRLRFEVAEYLDRQGGRAFYPRIDVTFEVEDASQHHHVPLLLSPFGYSTYRGS